MARRASFVYVEGLIAIRRLLKPLDVLVAEPWKRAMTALAEAGLAAGKAAAPVRSGRLQGKITARVQKKPFPMWAAVRSRGTRKSKKYPRGYPYPRLLEFSPKHGRKGWFTKSVGPKLLGSADAVLAKAGDEIAQKWAEGD